MYNSTWEKLPAELISTIFEQLDQKKDLLQCQLTCKSWTAYAQREFYKHICLDCRDSEKIEILAETLNKPSTNQQLGSLVKHLNLYSSIIVSPISYTKETLYRLLESLRENCLQIRTIHLDLKVSLVFSILDSFWESWTHKAWQSSLEQMTVCGDDISDISTAYTNISLFYKKTLKSFELRNRGSLIDITAKESGNDRFDLLKKELADSSFSSLEHLKIDVSSDNNIFQFDPLLPQNLKSLEMKTVLEKLDRLHIPSRQKGVEILEKNMSNIEQCLKLRELDLVAIFNSNDSLRYLVHKFPSLKRLIVNKSDKKITLEHKSALWKQSGFLLSEDTMSLFVDYLAKIQHFEIDHIYLDNHMNLIDTLIKDSKRKKASSYYISLDFQTLDSDSADSNCPQQKVKISKNTIDLSSKAENNANKYSDSYNIDIAISNDDSLVSSDQLMQSIERNIIGLKISGALDNNQKRKKFNLDTMFAKHQHIKELEIQRSEPFLQSNSIDLVEKEKNKSIEALVLSNCDIDLKTFLGVLKGLPNLKALSILKRNLFLGNGGDIVWNVDLSVLIAEAATFNLKTLKLTSLAQFVCRFKLSDDIKKKNRCCTTIETLVLTDCAIDIDIFPEVAERLPNLKSLHILGKWNKLLDSSGRRVKKINVYHLASSFPSLNTLQIHQSIPVLHNSNDVCKNGSGQIVAIL